MVYSHWEDFDWHFYEPRGYTEKFSREYKERIYIASFYYQDRQRAERAFDEFKTLLISNKFNESYLDVKINNTDKFDIIKSFALENTDFFYAELIETKNGYLPGYYILVVKSDISEKQSVLKMIKPEEPSPLNFNLYNYDVKEHRVRVIVDDILNNTYIIPHSTIGNGTMTLGQ